MMENFSFDTEKCVVEFYGNGCLNCQMMTPILSHLEQVMPNIRFYRVNADERPDLVEKYQITSLPTLLLFHHGKMMSSIVGVKTAQTLQRLIEENLNYA